MSGYNHPQPFDPKRLRDDFPLFDQNDIYYFDSAATTQKPRSVIEAINGHHRSCTANVHRAAHRLSREATEAFESARATVQRFINAADSREIIWTRGTTEGINLVAHSFGQQFVKPGDEILISTLEHHANIVPWQLLAERYGAVIKVIPLLDCGDLDLDAYQQLLNDRTRLVALCHVSNSLGTVNPIKTMIQSAHLVGAKVLIDGAQAVSHLAVDVQALDCDFYLFSGHKLYGPDGIGVLYGKLDLLEAMPPWQGGGEMIEKVSFERSHFQPPPLRFEAGTPNISATVGLASAIDYLQQFDLELRQSHEQDLLSYAQQRLGEIPGLKLICSPKQRIGLLPFVIDGLHTFDIGSWLDQHGIALRTGHHCTMPLHQRLGLEGSARASFGLYNQRSDIDRLVEALHALTQSDNDSTATCDKPNTPLFDQLLALKHWKPRYSLLMKTAQQADIAPDLRQDANLLHGCTSRVWLQHHYDPKTDTLSFRIDSDTRIIKGLGLLLLEQINGSKPAKVAAADLAAVLEQLQLGRYLSESRNNGVNVLINALKQRAQGCLI